MLGFKVEIRIEVKVRGKVKVFSPGLDSVFLISNPLLL